jgi:hypothetical protein
VFGSQFTQVESIEQSCVEPAPNGANNPDALCPAHTAPTRTATMLDHRHHVRLLPPVSSDLWKAYHCGGLLHPVAGYPKVRLPGDKLTSCARTKPAPKNGKENKSAMRRVACPLPWANLGSATQGCIIAWPA